MRTTQRNDRRMHAAAKRTKAQEARERDAAGVEN